MKNLILNKIENVFIRSVAIALSVAYSSCVTALIILLVYKYANQ